MVTDTFTDTHSHTVRCWWNPEHARWVCVPETAPASVDRPLVDVRDMIVVHTAMLREFRLAPAAVARTAPGDRRQVDAVAGHLQFLCELLHHHHAGEDELLWPKLRERVPDAGGVLDEVEAQHEAIDAALTAVQVLRASWAQHRTAGRRDELAAQLQRLHAVLRDHLELEERALLPLAAAALTDAEWHAVGEAAIAAMPKSALLLSFGLFTYEGDPAVLADMLRPAPLLPRVLLPRIAPWVYARRARKVHGTACP